MNRNILYIILATALVFSGCDTLFGSKQDAITDEIFDQGKIDPNLVTETGYVPVLPILTTGVAGDFINPTDVYIGYDELMYVTDESGLHVLDLAGRPADLAWTENGATTPYIPIQNASDVIQDRRLNVYVVGRRDTTIAGRTWNLSVIYRFSGLTQGAPVLEDIIWHPFDDDSRKFSAPNPSDSDQFRDEEVSYTGVAVLFDNRIYVSRKGPVNLTNSIYLPHNTVMEFTAGGTHTRTIRQLNPNDESLRSAINPSAILTTYQPPQRSSVSQNNNFVLAQQPEPGSSIRYSVLSILAVETPDGRDFRPNSAAISIAQSGDPEDGEGFMYEDFKFQNPSALAFAADGTNYTFVLDAGKDSLFVFNGNYVEGVAPPAGAANLKPAIVSFGGTGDGPLQFNNPQGMAYFDKIVYIADTDNNRILRFRLNTDFE